MNKASADQVNFLSGMGRGAATGANIGAQVGAGAGGTLGGIGGSLAGLPDFMRASMQPSNVLRAKALIMAMIKTVGGVAIGGTAGGLSGGVAGGALGGGVGAAAGGVAAPFGYAQKKAAYLAGFISTFTKRGQYMVEGTAYGVPMRALKGPGGQTTPVPAGVQMTSSDRARDWRRRAGAEMNRQRAASGVAPLPTSKTVAAPGASEFF